jgi:hypothetical protein
MRTPTPLQLVTVAALLVAGALAGAQQPASPPKPSAPAEQKPAAAAAPAPPATAKAGALVNRPVPEELQDAVAKANAITGAAPLPIGTMSELMVNLIYPTSDAILYISTRTPTNDVEWNELRAKALTLAEAANLLMMPSRAYDQGQWMKDAQLMLDAGSAAFEAAKKHDEPALEELNQAVYDSCLVCHFHYRPDYGKSPSP